MSDEGTAGGTAGDGDGDNGDPALPPRAVEDIDVATGEIVPASSSGVIFANAIGDKAIAAFVTDMNEADEESPAAIQSEIARRILSAESIEDVWAATKVLSAKEILNTPILVKAVRWVTSAHEEGAPKFAIIDGENTYSGKPVTVSCGALNVVLTLYKLQKFNALPAKVIIASKASSSDPGRSVLTIEPVAG